MNKKILTLGILIGLFSCTKPGEMNPGSPIVGEWNLHRIKYSGFPLPLNSYNRIDSNATRIGSHSFIFKQDSTYAETYSGYDYLTLDSLVSSKGADAGTWGLLYKSLSTITIFPNSRQEALTFKLDNNEFMVAYFKTFPQLRNYLSPTYTSPNYTETHYYRKRK